jgi:hypothetical protein
MPPVAFRRAVLATLAVFTMAACDNTAGTDDPGPAAAFSVVSGDAQSAAVGTTLPQPLVVRVTDADGRPVPNHLVNFVVTAGGGSLFAGAAQTDADGLAADRWTLGPLTADSQKVEVRGVDPVSGQARVYASFRATALPGAAVSLVKLSGDNQAAFPGLALAAPLAVRVVDANGNGVPGQSVTWSAQFGSILPASSTTNAQGVASAPLQLGAASVELVTASWSGHPVGFTARARGTRATVLSGNGQTAPAGTTYPDSLAVVVKDSAGQTVPAGVLVVWSAGNNPSLVSPAVARTRADGTARTSFTSETAASNYLVGAQPPGGDAASFSLNATGPIVIQATSDIRAGTDARHPVITAYLSAHTTVTSVTATMAGRTGTLTCNSSFTPCSVTEWRGVVDVSGVPSGLYPAVITVQDADGHTAQRTILAYYF